jgi:hypothetical protein
MAEFSKQYCESHDMGFDGDFDILEEFRLLEEDYYVPLICEGFGFSGIANIKGKCMLYFPPNNKDNETGKWINFDKLMSSPTPL